MSNKELDIFIDGLESELQQQEKDIEALSTEEEKVIIEVNLSKLFIMEKMKALHRQVKTHLDDETIEFRKIAPGIDFELLEK